MQGVRHHLRAAPYGSFRQMVPDPLPIRKGQESRLRRQKGFQTLPSRHMVPDPFPAPHKASKPLASAPARAYNLLPL